MTWNSDSRPTAALNVLLTRHCLSQHDSIFRWRLQQFLPRFPVQNRQITKQSKTSRFLQKKETVQKLGTRMMSQICNPSRSSLILARQADFWSGSHRFFQILAKWWCSLADRVLPVTDSEISRNGGLSSGKACLRINWGVTVVILFCRRFFLLGLQAVPFCCSLCVGSISMSKRGRRRSV